MSSFPSVHPSPSLQHYPNAYRLIQKMRRDVSATFAPAQIQAMEEALEPRTHTVDIRWTISFPGKGAYLILLAGSNLRRGASKILQFGSSAAHRPNAGRLLKRIPIGMRRTFTPTQIQALGVALVTHDHAIDVRLSLPILGKGIYIVFTAGPNRPTRYRYRPNSNSYARPTVFASVLIGAAILSGLVYFSSW
ncbi:MAG: hypothetical protein WBD47_14385 [Phormidesmis sp.]